MSEDTGSALHDSIIGKSEGAEWPPIIKTYFCDEQKAKAYIADAISSQLETEQEAGGALIEAWNKIIEKQIDSLFDRLIRPKVLEMLKDMQTSASEKEVPEEEDRSVQEAGDACFDEKQADIQDELNQIKNTLATEQQAHDETRDKLTAEQQAHRDTQDELNQIKNTLAAEQQVHTQTRDALTTEQQAHDETRDDLTAEKKAYGEKCTELSNLKTQYDTVQQACKSLSEDLKAERQAHTQTRDALTAEQQAHTQTRDDLTAEQQAHAQTRDALTAEQQAHTQTRDDLTAEQQAHDETRDKLTAEQQAHAQTRDKLTTEQQAHRDTQNELNQIKNTLAATQQAHVQTQDELTAEQQAHHDTQSELTASQETLEATFGTHRRLLQALLDTHQDEVISKLCPSVNKDDFNALLRVFILQSASWENLRLVYDIYKINAINDAQAAPSSVLDLLTCMVETYNTTHTRPPAKILIPALGTRYNYEIHMSAKSPSTITQVLLPGLVDSKEKVVCKPVVL